MDLAIIDETSETFLGQWKRLVSTTNWDKGRIIAEWRNALVAADAPVSEYSDEAWSRRVGNVTPQHVGRLRRVYERFGNTCDTYPGLFWSHFQAALDWDDAELWLEGALQNGWSISQMRRTRWETHGTGDEPEPQESEVVSAELDEDADIVDQSAGDASSIEMVRPVDDTDVTESAPFDTAVADDSEDEPAESEEMPAVMQASTEPHRPFADLPSLPTDVTEAFEAFKLCILRHRRAGWAEISLEDLCATLDALKGLAAAPPDAE